jgi:hypothetical protein
MSQTRDKLESTPVIQSVKDETQRNLAYFEKIFDSLVQNIFANLKKSDPMASSLQTKDGNQSGSRSSPVEVYEIRLFDRPSQTPSMNLPKISMLPYLEPSFARHIPRCEDRTHTLMNQVSSLNNGWDRLGSNSIDRKPSLAELELDGRQQLHHVTRVDNYGYKHFGRLASFLMRFFKSEKILEEDLCMSYNELLLLKSLIDRKFNKKITVK